MAALIGTAIERNTAISSRNDSTTTAPITQTQPLAERVGRVDAGRGVAADEALAAGAGERRRDHVVCAAWCTSCSVSAFWGDESGITTMVAASPAWLSWGGTANGHVRASG